MSDHDNAHHLLIAALKVTPPELHPPRPFHGGGPQPKVDAAAYVLAGLWLAERVEPLVDDRDRTDFVRWVELARRQVALGSDDTSLRKQLFGADAGKASRVPLKIGVWAAHEAANWAFRPIYAGGAARPAAGQLAKLLVKKGQLEEASAYLRALDSLCLRIEAMTVLRDRKLAPTGGAEVERVLWRGHEQGKASHWLMQLSDGRFALLCKSGARWRLHEGTRDEVLASVGDAHFEAAVRVALA